MKNVKGGEIKIDLLKRERERDRERDGDGNGWNGDRKIFETDKTETVWTKSVCERWRWRKMDRLSVYLDKFAKQERLNNEKGIWTLKTCQFILIEKVKNFEKGSKIYIPRQRPVKSDMWYLQI